MPTLDWQRFGDPTTFAVEFKMDSDPDGGRGTDPVEAASWGAFRLWVDGRNLCDHQSPSGLQDAVHWYLLPLLEWLAGNWAPLVHEERLPFDGKGDTARDANVLAMRRYLGNIDPRAQACCEQWQDWWRRHALRSCRKGGIFPDVFLRRLRDSIEVSWGSQRLPGMPKDVFFVAPEGAVTLSVAAIAEPLRAMLERAVDTLDQGCAMDDRRLDRLAAAVRGIEGANAAVQEEWFIDPLRAGRPGEGILARARRSVAGASEAAMDAIFGGRRGSGYVTAFSEAALMFGSLSPRIGDADVAAVAKVLIDSFDPRGEAAALSRLVRDEPLSPTRRAHEEGQDLALDLLDDLGLPRSADSSIDVDAILSTLQIHLLRLDLNDSNIRGLAIAGQQNRPTIVVNTAHFMNQRAEGERFTIAHELCHVLHDRGYGRRVSLASGPWAPASVERRANAFAAMLLMPPEIVRRATAAASKPVETLGGATEVARRMQTGLRATIEHLGNLGEVGEADREHLLFELDGLMEQRAN